MNELQTARAGRPIDGLPTGIWAAIGRPKTGNIDRQYSSIALNLHLPSARRAGYPGLSAIELTALQFLTPKLTLWSRWFPPRNDQSSKPRVQMELQMTKLVARFVKDESGATAIEYGLIASGIALAIIAAVTGTGTKLSGTFTNITASLK
jgi:pilus assembly protein Flp/PilA